MAKISADEMHVLKLLFEGRNQGVLDFDLESFLHFFRSEFNIDINSYPFCGIKTGKYTGAYYLIRSLRDFYEKEDGEKVGRAIELLVNRAKRLYKAKKDKDEITPELINEGYAIARRLQGLKVDQNENSDIVEKEKKSSVAEIIGEIDFSKIPIEKKLKSILKGRLDEMGLCFDNGVYLSAIIMAGSVLEGVLLGYAMQNPEKFNQSKCCPKDKKSGKPFPFNDWSLAQLIDAAKEIGALNDDMKKFGHSLREYRNYIHPHEQLKEGFKASRENTHLCLQALIYALQSLMAK